MISNYHYLKRIFLSVHSLIRVQWLGSNCQIKHTRQGILLALNSRYPMIQLFIILSYFFNDSFLVIILYFK